MDSAISTVNWHSYAQTYDMLLDYNPFYQQLREEVFRKIIDWDIEEGALIADIGAGTGNYSLKLAKTFPQAQIIHVDNNNGMCDLTQRKVEESNLTNLQVRRQTVEALQFEKESLNACLCIHSLYTFPEPQKVIQRIYDWVKPGGIGIFVDPGRTVNVLDWQLAIGWHMIKKYGFRKTFQLLREGKEISHQNRQISKLHAQGIYWKHSQEEFCSAIREAGFEIISAQYCFRNISDMVLWEKPK